MILLLNMGFSFGQIGDIFVLVNFNIFVAMLLKNVLEYNFMTIRINFFACQYMANLKVLHKLCLVFRNFLRVVAWKIRSKRPKVFLIKVDVLKTRKILRITLIVDFFFVKSGC